jgi:hypothetical protein
MVNNDSSHRSELPKLTDDGTNNNYGEWKTKSFHKLREWDLLKYIEGPNSTPPTIPSLRETITYHGVDDNNQLSTVHVLGNATEHQQAVIDAQPWMTGNNVALSRIVASIPSHQLHLVQQAKFAKQAWESLSSVYQPRNSLRAATVKGQLMTYRCTMDMNVTQWLGDMQRLYNSLCDLDVDHMSNRDFALAIIDLMPQEDGWRTVVSNLRAKVRDLESKSLPIDSMFLVHAIRDEDWFRHNKEDQSSSHIFTARADAQKRSSSSFRKRLRPADIVATTLSPNPPSKRVRTVNPEKAHLRCSNPHCGPKVGHETADCIAYKGAKEGQYGDWWRGPWNIHLPEAQRSKENNVPPKNHPAYSRLAPSVNQLRSDNSCHHDSGANRHVFHDRSAFEHYESIAPLTVKGFGENLSAVAIGRGSVRLEGQHNSKKCSILLNDVLHIPAARTNLISGIQLDRAGVVSTLGNKSITLSTNNHIIVSGSVVNDMYRLNLRIVPPTSVSLASRITPTNFASRIGPKQMPQDFYTA